MWPIFAVILVIAAMLSFCTAGVLVYTILPAMGNAHHGVVRNECSAQLVRIYAAIIEYIARHDDVPRDDVGQFSIKPLFDGRGATSLNGNLLQCPANQDVSTSSSDYVVNPRLVARNFRNDAAPRVVMCDKADNHHDMSGDRSLILVLFTNGYTQVCMGQRDEYVEWIRDLADFDANPSLLPPEYD